MEAFAQFWNTPSFPLPLNLPAEIMALVHQAVEKIYWTGFREGFLSACVLLLIGFQFLLTEAFTMTPKRVGLGVAALFCGFLLLTQIQAHNDPLINLPSPVKPVKPANPWWPFKQDAEESAVSDKCVCCAKVSDKPMPKICSCTSACRCGDECYCNGECRCLDQCHCGEIVTAGRRQSYFESLPNSAGNVTIGGPVGPDSKTEVATDLPVDQRAKNVGGRDGAGLCVFTSIMHSARWQDEKRLCDFQKQMKAELGGGYPQKVDQMIAKYGPGTPYLQYEGNDPTILLTALKSGRMPAVTYCGMDPHYGPEKSVAHMTNLVAYDPQKDLAAILDNNFIGENEIVWMSCQDFLKRWKGMGGGWCVILLAPPPAPIPHN